MPEVGQILREAREKKSLSLEDVELVLKIRQKFLVALENDQRIPLNEIYMRGFLQNYARFLGLDPVHIVNQYSGHEEVVPVIPAPVEQPAPAPFHPMDMDLEKKVRPYLRPIAIGVLVIVIVGGMVGAAAKLARGAGTMSPAQATAAWAATRVIDPGKSQGNGVALASGSPTASPTITPTPGPTETPTITPTPTPVIYTGVDIELAINERAWLQVRVDGQKVFEGIQEGATRKSWHGNDIVQVRCGNAGGVEAFVNGTSVGLLGEQGKVVDTEWQKETAPAAVATVIPVADVVTVAASPAMTVTADAPAEPAELPAAATRRAKAMAPTSVPAASTGVAPQATP